jgi:choline-sulfatase
MTPKNLLFIFSDEHTQEITGCYGNPMVRTPVLDRLAAGGTRFDNAYTNCPICVPARASLAKGALRPPDRLLGQRPPLHR